MTTDPPELRRERVRRAQQKLRELLAMAVDIIKLRQELDNETADAEEETQ